MAFYHLKEIDSLNETCSLVIKYCLLGWTFLWFQNGCEHCRDISKSRRETDFM